MDLFHSLDRFLNRVLRSGGFGSYMIAMDQRTYELIGADYPGNRAEDVKNPSLGWMIGFMFVVSFLGLFSLVPLRKVLDRHLFICLHSDVNNQLRDQDLWR